MECGQVFGWHKRDGAYLGIVEGRAVALAQAGRRIAYTVPARFDAAHLTRYLGLDEDLEKIIASVTVDSFMTQVFAAVKGLRLLKQDPWHCLCSYLLSSSNRVERIDKIVKEIARRWGTCRRISGVEVCELPLPAALAHCGEPAIRACGAGFRSPYLARAARRVADGSIDFDRIRQIPYAEAKEVLMTLDGVGDKIADCVLLFAFQKYEAFPVDVWIKKAIEAVYFKSKPVKNDEIRKFAGEHFGPYAGYAQEYIYHYARTHDFGR
jgi:N-glycosylase/DNA lyase